MTDNMKNSDIDVDQRDRLYLQIEMTDVVVVEFLCLLWTGPYVGL